MRSLILILVLVSGIAQGTEYSQYYSDSSGKRLEASVAIMSSIKGNEVYRCQTVEAKASKSGTSIGMHNVKKPKLAKIE